LRRVGLGGMLRNAVVMIVLTGIFLLGYYIFDPAGFYNFIAVIGDVFRNMTNNGTYYQ
jgi:hypothetical protein